MVVMCKIKRYFQLMSDCGGADCGYTSVLYKAYNEEEVRNEKKDGDGILEKYSRLDRKQFLYSKILKFPIIHQIRG